MDMNHMDHSSECDHVNCTAASSNPSVTQTLSEMDWERSLWNAAFSGEKERVRNLIARSKDPKEAVNAVDKSGYTPLHYAARSGQVDICRILLQNGASINAQTKCGLSTPLHKAAAGGKALTLKFLVSSGADLELQDADGKTALHKLTENRYFNLAEILVEACPHINEILDYYGNPAIYI